MNDALATLAPPGAATGGQRPAPAPGNRPQSGIMSTFAWHPDLAKAYFIFNNHLFHSTLSDRMRELVTIRTGWAVNAEYEWAQHVRMGKQIGMTDEEIDALTGGDPDSPVWSPVEATVVRAVDELCKDRHISDATWAKLEAQLNRQEIMDVVFTALGYDLLGTAMNTFGLGLDPGLPSFPPRD
jgi:alkylhydroperoxidase family enzyme